MNVFPVVAREMRAQARQPATYWYRLAGAGGLLVVGMLMGTDRWISYQEGTKLFWAMHWFLFWTIWGLVPMMTADCISRERREGTLGLLFLTPLMARDIVLAKGIVDGLRAATLGVAAVPVLVVPFLLGGVNWASVLCSVTCNLSALWLAMGAGLLASSRQTALHRALGRAYGYAALFLFAMPFLVSWWLELVILLDKGHSWRALSGRWYYTGPGISVGFYALSGGIWDIGLGQTPGLTNTVSLFWRIVFQVGIAGGAFLAFLLLIQRASVNVRRLVLERPRSLLQVELERIFCTPRVARGLFVRWMRWKIERNPIGWLEQRTWQARAVTWGWLAVMISLYSMVLMDSRFFLESFRVMQPVLGSLILLSMAVTSAGSFRRERESGVLELLLVSPLSARRIVLGRLRGIWNQFLPAVLLLAGVWIYIGQAKIRMVYSPPTGFADWEEAINFFVIFLAAYGAVPAIGLYFSLRCSAMISALVWTVVCLFLGTLGTVMLADFLDIVVWMRSWASPEVQAFTQRSVLPALSTMGIGLWLGLRVQVDLARRRFALRHP